MSRIRSPRAAVFWARKAHIVNALVLFGALGLASATIWASSAIGDAVHVEIPRGTPLDTALIRLARAITDQTGMHVMIASKSVGQQPTDGLSGTFSAGVALRKLLRGSHLTYQVSDDTIAIKPASVQGVTDRGSFRATKSGPTDEKNLDNGQEAGSGKQPRSGRKGTDVQSEALQEVVVTAQKFSQRAFDVPMSLQVVSEQELEQQGITDLSSLQYDVPGLYLNSTGSQRAVYLRGVGNSFGTGPMVGQYIDDADITGGGFTGGPGYLGGDNGLYDLQRVEVLKGPQGTLYGDGSLGGVIRYITNKPVLDQYEMGADVTALVTEYGAPSQHVETMLNAPIINGSLGLRVAGMFEHDGGWVDEPAAGAKNINDSNLADVRVEALWQPTPQFRLNATQTIHDHTWGVGSGEDANGNITPLFDTAFIQSASDSSKISNVTMTYDFLPAQLLSSSTYSTEQEDLHNLYTAVPSIEFWEFQPYFTATNEMLSEELRLSSTAVGPWQWTVGGFYKHFHDFNAGPVYFGSPGSTLSSAFYLPEDEDTSGYPSDDSWAGFANTSYSPVKPLTIGAGVRYFRERVSQEGNGVPLGSARFASTDPRFYVQYQFTPHVNVYASASKGFRSGGFNFSPTEPTYQPETLWSYDLGGKLFLPSAGVRADVDLFDMSYTNYVTTAVLLSGLTELTNAGDSRIRGVDADLTWQPRGTWRFGLNTELVNSKFLTADAVSGYTPGDRLPYSPTYSFTSSVARDFKWNSKPSYVELSYYEISRVQYRQQGLPLGQSDILRFLSARMGVQWSDSLSLRIFAENLLNDRGNESPLYIESGSVRSRPRTFGVDFDCALR